MPSPEEILAGLGRISNDAFAFAVLWHVVVAAVGLALVARWRPDPRVAGAMACTPLASVSAFAWAHGNPFNGAAFALLTATLALIAWRAREGGKPRVPWATALGALLVGFAWVYPHFLEGRSPLAYLVGAPVGLIPCPTLSLVIGFTLLGYGPGARAWSLTLALAGLFYAVFGALRLGVVIDLVLLAGAVGLVVRELASHRARVRPVH